MSRAPIRNGVPAPRHDAGESSPFDRETPFVPLGPGPTAATPFGCPLCGMRFAHGEKVCGSCPLNAGCDLVKCPNCGYQFPRTSKLVEWGRRLIRRVAPRPSRAGDDGAGMTDQA